MGKRTRQVRDGCLLYEACCVDCAKPLNQRVLHFYCYDTLELDCMCGSP